MKIRTGFVSNSSSSSFVLTKDINNEELTVQKFLIRLLSDLELSSHFRDVPKMLENIKSFDNDDVYYHLDGDYDDTRLFKKDNTILLDSSNHYNWDSFLDRFYKYHYDESAFYDDWYSDDYKDNKVDGNYIKNNIFVPKYGALFIDIKYKTCNTCERFQEQYNYKNTWLCPSCHINRLNSLNRIQKIKKILI
jgi:hypothetical protein